MAFMKVRAAVSSALFAALLLTGAAAARADTLTDALIAAYNNSGLLQQNQALLRAADEDVAQAVAILRPIISYAANATYSDPVAPGSNNLSSSVALNADLLLYDFGNSQLAIDAAKETVLATREALVGVEQQVLLRAVRAFMNVRLQGSVVALRQNNVRLLTQQLRATRDRFDVGEVTRTDVSQAEAALAAARSGLASAQGDLAQAREEYRAAVGRYPGVLDAPPPAPAISRSLDAAKAVARQRHPDLRKAQRDVTVAEINIRRGEANLRPTLNATGSVSVDDGGDDRSSVGVTLSGPIYRGGQLSSILRASRALRDSARGILLTTQLLVDQNVGNAWASLSVAAASEQASQQQVRASRLALRGVQEEFQLGARTTLDVLDQEQDLLDAETGLITAQTNRYVAVYEVLSSMGLLTAEHLNLGVIRYDPAAYYDAVKNAPVVNVSPQGERLDRVLKSLGKQ